MKWKIRRIIITLIKLIKINKLMFYINRRNNFISVDASSVKKAIETLEKCSENPNTTCITENTITKKYDLHIIIPAYNVEAYLEKCLNSVFAIEMDYSYFVTVVNDGSKDRTGEILKRYEERDNLLIINQANKGFSGARNAALKNIYGKYIMFVDSDDSIEPSNIEKMIKKAMQGDYDVVEGGFYTTDINGKIVLKTRMKEREVLTAVGNLRGQPWGKVFKAELFENICFPEKYWFEDTILAEIVYPQVKKAFIISDVVYYYLINPKGITRTISGKSKAIDSFYIVAQLFEDRHKLGLCINQDYYEHILRIIQLTFKRTDKLSDDVKESVFVLWYDFIKKNFANVSTKVKRKKELEKALREKNFGYYMAACKYL